MQMHGKTPSVSMFETMVCPCKNAATELVDLGQESENVVSPINEIDMATMWVRENMTIAMLAKNEIDW